MLEITRFFLGSENIFITPAAPTWEIPERCLEVFCSLEKKTPVFWGGRPIAMFDQRVIYVNLVGGIPTPLKNMGSSAGMMKFPIYGKIKNVPNHQPVNLRYPATPSAFYFWLRSANFPTFCGILWQIFRKWTTTSSWVMWDLETWSHF